MSGRQSPTFVAAKRYLREQGWSVIPVREDGKRPAVKWKQYQETKARVSDLIDWFEHQGWHTGIVTGRVSGIVVLDIDTEEAYEWWLEQVGEDVLATCARQITPKSNRDGGSANLGHYVWSYPGGPKSWGNRGAEGWDLRGDGGYIKVEPSPHYEWAIPWTPEIPPLPEEVQAVLAVAGTRRASHDGDDDGGEVVVLDRLASLLSNPGVGGRNNWVAKCLGHYAKTYKWAHDLYVVHAEQVYLKAIEIPADHPYEREEFERTVESIWNKELGKQTHDFETGLPVVRPDNDNGFLVGTGTRLLVQVRIKSEDGTDTGMAEWADFDIEAIGVVNDETSERVYDVRVKTDRNPEGRRSQLRSNTLADPRRLVTWLADFGVSVVPPDNVWPRSGTISARLIRYLEAQNPPNYLVVEALGWHDDGFITHDGVIRAHGPDLHDGRRPTPHLVNRAPFRYGFILEDDEAVAVLREIMTFHDETVTAVFTAWWAACTLKPQILQGGASLFPFMALEAPSESGKSTGFFALMLQLNGNPQKQGTATKASFRDAVASHKSGIVWVDDHDDIEDLGEVLRGATADGTMTKKGEDRTSQVQVTLVAPILVSGEALGMGDQKALLDRSIKLEVPSPTSRRSLNDPTRPQWDDIVALNQRYNHDLTCMAGNMVQLILQRAHMVDTIKALRPEVGGRWGDKIAIVRLGARIVADIIGDESVIARVDAWAETQDYLGSENSLTTKLLPTALAVHNWPQIVSPPDRFTSVPTPVLVRDEEVLFCPRYLAEWWNHYRRGHVIGRTESYEAIKQQAVAQGLSGTRRGSGNKAVNVRVSDRDENKTAVYWRCGPTISQVVLARSRGELDDGGPAVSTGGTTGSPPAGPPAGFHPEKLRQESLGFQLSAHPNMDGEGL